MERQKEATGCDEVVFLNRKGELTEGTRTNLFLELDGRLFTPALTCGLLPGTLREELIDLPRAAASEAVLTIADLARAERIYLGNSVRASRARAWAQGSARGGARRRGFLTGCG
jgi:para-aminobenzoate synthetase/4-amino-4-deoxychorismate lyase